MCDPPGPRPPRPRDLPVALRARAGSKTPSLSGALGGRREGTDQELARLSGGDPDVSPQGIDSGEETPGGSNPTPGQDLVDEIGGAVGVTYQDDEPLKFDEKYATRDEERWENNPASSEDYQERQITTESDAPGSIPSSNKKNRRRKSPRSDDGNTNQT